MRVGRWVALGVTVALGFNIVGVRVGGSVAVGVSVGVGIEVGVSSASCE